MIAQMNLNVFMSNISDHMLRLNIWRRGVLLGDGIRFIRWPAVADHKQINITISLACNNDNCFSHEINKI